MLQVLDGPASLDDLANASGLKTSASQNEAVAELRRLGLLQPRALALTLRGHALVTLSARRPHLVAEAVHAIYLRLAVEGTDASRVGPGWAYRQVCASVWASGTGPFDRAGVIGRVVAGAAETFGLDEGRIAFSGKSVTGVTNWLGALEPPVYRRSGSPSTIMLRHVCPPEAVWWAVDAMHYADGKRIPAGVRLPLAGDSAELLCRQLLVHPASLDRVLAQAKRRSDFSSGGIFDTGMAGGMGRWVLLSRELPPPCTDEHN